MSKTDQLNCAGMFNHQNIYITLSAFLATSLSGLSSWYTQPTMSIKLVNKSDFRTFAGKCKNDIQYHMVVDDDMMYCNANDKRYLPSLTPFPRTHLVPCN